MKPLLNLLFALFAFAIHPIAFGQKEGHDMDRHNMHQADAATEKPAPAADQDERQLVRYPDQMKAHTLMSMRDHLVTLQRIQRFLSNREFDAAAEIAEQRLGMSSLQLHGAHEAAKFMPTGMRAAGTAMHRTASQFARTASDSSVTGDIAAALGSLADLTSRCVACHDGYRLN